MIKMSHDEIWYWYKTLQSQRDSGIPFKRYADENGIDYKKFSNMKYRLEYKSESDPKLYAQYVPITRHFLESGTPISKYCKEHKVDIKVLSTMVTHLGYVDIIEKLEMKEDGKQMQFIQVPTINLPMPTVHPEPEVLKKQNNVELIISAGVKVVVAPEVGADKLIRIIELLKDL